MVFYNLKNNPSFYMSYISISYIFYLPSPD